MSTPETKQACCKTVIRQEGMRFPRPRPCSIAASVERDGKHYCKIHDPVAVAEKDKARREKWDAEQAAKHKRWARQSQIVEACKGMEDPVAEVASLRNDREILKRLLRGFYLDNWCSVDEPRLMWGYREDAHFSDVDVLGQELEIELLKFGRKHGIFKD